MLTLGDWRGGGWRLQGQGRGEGGGVEVYRAGDVDGDG
jgi:hypothetical protein